MSIYRSVALAFWTDTKVCDDFTPEDRYMYLYILTNPHTNLCGCYEVSMKQIANETGYNTETCVKLLKRLDAVHGVIRYSSRTRELLILNWYRYNWSSSGKLDKPILAGINEIKCESFRSFVLDHYNKRGTVARAEVPPSSEDPVPEITSATDQEARDSFEVWWKAYPRKVGKIKAQKSYSKALKLTTAEVMLKAVENQKQSDQWQRDDGRYIPHPATWLNQGRWDDVVEEQGNGTDNVFAKIGGVV